MIVILIYITFKFADLLEVLYILPKWLEKYKKKREEIRSYIEIDKSKKR